ncbi:hypothetical protein EC915_101591 [Pseudomonas sp. LP_7_YM]|nr:hypothetical protein EC915_101591 [Pseudomonas sp. LP_7_YM]
MIVITGASGQRGKYRRSGAHPEKAEDLVALGVQVRKADYSQPGTLDSAFAGAEKVAILNSLPVATLLQEFRHTLACVRRNLTE